MGSSSLHFVFEDNLGQSINPHEIFATTGLLLSSGGDGPLTLDSASGSVDLAPGDSLSFGSLSLDGFETVLAAAEPTALRTITLPDADGDVVLDTATQSLTNKTINGLALTEANDGFTITGGVTPSTLTLNGGNLTLADAFTTSGAHPLTLTTEGTTAVTLPTNGTLATLSGTETLENVKITSGKIDVRSADISTLESSFANITQIVGTAASLELASVGEVNATSLVVSGTAIFTGATVTGISADLNAGGDLDGNELTLDADADTSITADTDDQIDFEIGGTDLVRMSAATSIALTSDAATAASGITFGTTGTSNLYRSAANTLTTDDRFTIGGSLSFGGSLEFSDDTGSATGGIVFGTVNTANLYRSAGNTITTDDSFIVAGSLTLSGTSTSAASGITFATDTNLYRSAANTLATDDRLSIGGSLSFGGSLEFSDNTGSATGGIVFGTVDTANLYRSAGNTITTDDSFIVAGSLTLSGTGGTVASGITFATDTTLFRTAANTLETDDSFIIDGSLTVNDEITVTGSIEVGGQAQVSGKTVVGGSLLVGQTPLASGTALTVSDGWTTGLRILDASGSTLLLASDDGDAASGITFGTIAGDVVTLYRSAADTLSTDDSFIVAGSLTLQLNSGAANSGITFGTTNSTNLYRSAASTLRTDNDFVVGASLTVTGSIEVGGQAQIGGKIVADGSLLIGRTALATGTASTIVNGWTTGLSIADASGSALLLASDDADAASGITFGTIAGDIATLYRSAADTLTTDDSYIVAGSLTLQLNSGAANSGITFGTVDTTNLYRSAIATLRTDNDFIVGGSLTVTGSIDVGGQAQISGRTVVGGSLLVGQTASATGTALTILDSWSTGLSITDATTSTLLLASDDGDAASGITFGTTNSTNLYRSAASTLRTDNSLTVGASLVVEGSLTLQITSGASSSGITFGTSATGTTNLYRVAGNLLQTDGALVVTGSLTVNDNLFVSGSLSIGTPATTTASLTIRSALGDTSTNTVFSVVSSGNTTARLTAAGSLLLDGGVTATQQFISSGSADVAEEFNVLDDAGAGDLVIASNGYDVKKSSRSYEPSIVGVIATNPAINLQLGPEVRSLSNAQPVALVGRVPVNVTNENGAIIVGDYITSSSRPGYGMKATKAGLVVGMALENFNKGAGQVLVKVATTYWEPPPPGEGTFASLAGSNGMLGQLNAGTATFTEVNSTYGHFANLDADGGLFDNLTVIDGTFDLLAATTGTFGLMDAATGSFEEVQAMLGTFENLEAGSATFTNLVVTSGMFEELVLATSKSGTHWEPRDQGLDGGLVSSLRALL